MATESVRVGQCRSSPEELPHVRDKWWWLRGATQPLRLGADAEMSYPMPEVRGCDPEEQPHLQGAAAAQRAERSYSTFKFSRGDGEEIPLVQDKE